MFRSCKVCEGTYPDTDFYRDRSRKDGLRHSCKSCDNRANRKWREDNAERRREYNQRYKKQNAEKGREQHRQWIENNYERWREYSRQYSKKRYARNPKVRISAAVTAGVKYSLCGGKGNRSWTSLVDFSLEELMEHLESQFEKGMTWNNCGSDWHLDHIRPIADFHFTTTDDLEFKECWSLWNLQPLWAAGNWSKGAKCEAPPLPFL